MVLSYDVCLLTSYEIFLLMADDRFSCLCPLRKDIVRSEPALAPAQSLHVPRNWIE
jgi:hypothetical protein